jgi:hypothetical protein
MSSRNYSAREPSWDLNECASVQDVCPPNFISPILKRKRDLTYEDDDEMKKRREIIFDKMEQIDKEEEERERKRARKNPKSFIEILKNRGENNPIEQEYENSDSDSNEDEDDDDQGLYLEDEFDDEESQRQCFEDEFIDGYENGSDDEKN